MASARSTGKKASRSSGAGKASTKSRSTRGTQASRKQVDTRIVDAGMRRELAGIAIIVLAVALFIGAVMQGSGVVTQFITHALKVSLGVGAYILPVALVIIGACLIIRFGEYRIPTRVALGTAIILLAILVILGLSTPGASTGDLSHFFDEAELIRRGGYVGAGIAWVLCELLGQVISIILMVGAIIAGLIIIGFSVSNLLAKLSDMRQGYAERLEARAQARQSQAMETAYRDEYRAPKVTHAKGRQQALPTSGADARWAEDDGPYDDVVAATKPLPGAARQQQKAEKDSFKIPAFLQGGTSRTSAKDASAAPTVAFPQSTYIPPASPLPEDPFVRQSSAKGASYAQPVEVVETETVSPSAPTQTFTRKLSRKDASQTASADQDPSMTTKLRAAAEAKVGGYHLPSMSLLKAPSGNKNAAIMDAQARETAALVESSLADFGVNIQVVGWVCGPTVTLYKLALPAGMRVAQIGNLRDDLSRVLAVPGIRVFSPVPGTPYVGIEVPNKQRDTVLLADVLKDAKPGPLMIAIGKNVDGSSVVADLAKMPHLLIGGTTGSGKTVAAHSMIVSILMRATPEEVRFIMIDPKRVEFNHYEGIPHLYVPPVTDAKEASSALSWAVAEMELRLKKFQKAGARDIGTYNKMVDAGTLDVENPTKMPYIVIVIDELADLMMNVGKEVEFSISRIAQLARAAGIHLIVATQRPDAKIVTGLIKANIATRIACKVANGINSRVIIDQPGAENLVGNGDMLFLTTSSPKPVRLQGCYVSDEEIDRVVAEWKKQGEPEYNDAILTTNKVTVGDQKTDGLGGEDDDPLLWEAADLVVSNNFASTSTIQRKLSVGYARAGRIMDQLEQKGIVGPPNGSKPREVIVSVEELETIKAFDSLD